jgi:DnaJ-class molecular chaperone
MFPVRAFWWSRYWRGKGAWFAHMKTCPDCNGDGVIEKGTDDEQQCPTCGGSGFVPDDDDGQEEVIHTRQPN